MAWKLIVAGKTGRYIEGDGGEYVCGAIRPEHSSVLLSSPRLLAALKSMRSAVARIEDDEDLNAAKAIADEAIAAAEAKGPR